MARQHEKIVDMIILQWSKENRGRLFKNHNGKAYVGKKIDDMFERDTRLIKLQHAIIIKYGLGKGTSDLVGWEFIDRYPVFCCVEIKTKKSPKITQEQKDWLNNLLAIGGKAYLAKENGNGYDLLEWEIR
jgi:hypothetical protein